MLFTEPKSSGEILDVPAFTTCFLKKATSRVESKKKVEQSILKSKQCQCWLSICKIQFDINNGNLTLHYNSLRGIINLFS